MTIETNPNASADWAAALSKSLAGVKSAEGIEPSATLDGDNLIITVRNTVTGGVRQCKLTLPELDPAQDSGKASELLLEISKKVEDMVLELKALADEMAEVDKFLGAGKNAPAGSAEQKASLSNVRKMMFDIYELINLMQQIGQQQRDAARKLRDSELASEISSIKSQATAQKNAGKYGLIASFITAGVQGLFMLYSAKRSISSLSATNKCAASQEIAVKQNQIKTLQANDLDQATANVQGIESSLSKTQMTEIGSNQEISDFNTAQTDYRNAMKELTKFQDEHPDVDLPEGNAELNQEQRQLKDLQKNVCSTYDKYAKATTALKGTEGTLTTEFNQKTEEAKTAESDYVDKYSRINFRSNGRYEGTMKDARNAQMVSGGKLSLARAKVVEATYELDTVPTGYDQFIPEGTNVARAAKPAQPSQAVRDQNLVLAKDEKAGLELKLQSDEGFRLQSTSAMRASLLTQFPQIFNGIGQSTAQMVSSAQESKATLEQADQKEHEKYRDEALQIFNDAQDLIKNVRGLLQAVIQAEAQSVEQIIRA